MARTRERKTPDRGGLDIGDYEQAVTAAVAHDLAELLLHGDRAELNFGGGMLYDLVPVFGADVVAGLNPRLPAGFREAVAGLVERFGG